MPNSKAAAKSTARASEASATAGTITDTEQQAVDALIATTGKIPTTAEMKVIHEQDEIASSERAFVGDVRIAPNSAV